MKPMWTGLAACAFAFAAQGGVIVVAPAPGPGVAFTEVSAAVAAAASGDVILIRDGDYAPFELSLPLTLVADGPAVTIKGGILVKAIAANQSVVIRGIRVEPAGFAPTNAGIQVENCAGRVRVEDCWLQGRTGVNALDQDFQPGGPGAQVIKSASVAFLRCDLVGGAGKDLSDPAEDVAPTDGGDGLLLTGAASTIALYDCTLRGGAGGSDVALNLSGGNGGRGCSQLATGTMFASGSSFLGGAGGWSGVPQPPALPTAGDGGNGGDGAALGGHLTHLSCTFAGGAGGPASWPGGSAGLAGLALHVLGGFSQPFPIAARHFKIATPARENQLTSFTLAGQPGDFAMLAASATPGHLYLPAFKGPFLLAPPATFVSVGTLPGTSLVVPFTMPALPPGVDAAVIHVQSFFGASGGSTVLGPASVFVALSAAF